MELENFIKGIEEILEDNCIKYFYINVGHVQIHFDDKSLLYFTKDLMIFFNEDNCVIDLQLSNIEGIYYIKEMTITLDDEDYGYRHCVLKHRNTNKIHEFKLNTPLTENELNDIIDYIINCIKNSDLESLRDIWKKSLSRNEYKKKYQKFNIELATLIDNDKLEELEETFDCAETKNGEIIFFFKDDEINFNYI